MDLPIFCVVKILDMIQPLFSAQPMVLFASTTVCISPTPFSVQDSWDTLECQLGQLAFGSMKLPGMFLFLRVAWLRNTCQWNINGYIDTRFSCKIVDVKLAESASETCLRVWIIFWPVVYLLLSNVHIQQLITRPTEVEEGAKKRCKGPGYLIVSKDGIALYGDCLCWYVCWENGHLYQLCFKGGT